jgi:hypothetical protein
MASEIRVNTINNRSGLGTITISDTGAVFAGVTTITSLQVTGTLIGVANTDNIRTNTNATFLQNVNVSGAVTSTGMIVTGVTTVAAGSTSVPSISPSGDTNTGIFFPSADTIAFGEGGAESARIDSSGRFGIGTNSVNTTLEVLNSSTPIIRVGDGTRHMELRGGSTTQNAAVGTNYNGAIDIIQNGTPAASIDTSKRLLVGTTSARSNFYNDTNSAFIQLESASNDGSALALIQNFNANTLGGQLILAKSNSASVGSNTLVASGDACGRITFQGNDGTQFVEAAQIRCDIDGTPGANDMPGRLVFSTTADGAASPTERWRITSGGAFYSNSSSIYIGTGGAQMSGGGRIIIRGDFYNGTAGQELTTSDDSNGAIYMQFGNSVGTRIGSITRASSTSIAFNSTSDYRLKENIAKVKEASQKIKQLCPVTFNFIGHADELSTGFIAHELQEIIPEAVSGAKDAVYADGTPNYQGVDQSKLVPLLTAALQEAITKIETLEARLTALETA